jgi:Rps23 Pro-64 3,4-dihydroxylase Tpa1-like proline 4-hydroxylase
MNRKELALLIVDKLDSESVRASQQWNNPEGTSTRHFVIDDFLPPAIAKGIYDAFPKTGDGFYNRDTFREKKRTSANLSEYEPILGEITYALQDPKVVAKVAELAGLQEIEPDPSLYAGGLSMMFNDDFLNPHIDNSHDGERARFRRLNILLYVTPEWQLENGGNFELWDRERKVPKTLISKFNRLIVMETNKLSWHSVSKVVKAGPRCCVSNYYFSKISPDETDYFHVTSFSGRPDETIKRVVGTFDNALRNTVSKVLKVGRGKKEINKIGE